MMIPYRIRRFFSYLRYDVPYGIKNLIRWFPVIWNDRDWDWFFMANLMKTKADQMAKIMELDQWVGADKAAKQLRALSKDLQFIMDDDMDEEVTRPSVKRHGWRMGEAQQRIGRLISKHFMSWWD